jgi:glycosyltransferase involved in cell wall biosynthesis
MRILFILDKSFPPDPRVENEIAALLDDGFDITIFCLRHSRIEKANEKSKSNFTIHRQFVPRLFMKFSALAYSVPVYSIYIGFKLRKYLKENKFEVIHIHDIQAACFVPWNEDSKYVLDFHEYRSEIMKEYAHVKSLLGRLLINPRKWRQAESKYASKCDKLIVVTEEAKDLLFSELVIEKTKIVVVPNSVSKFYKRGESAKFGSPINILYLGDTGERRGLETAINGLRKAIDKGFIVSLTIVGSSNHDKILKDMVHKLNLEKYIEFIGWVEPDRFHEYLSKAHVGISPLHRNLHHDTTYANKLMQYLAYGIPLLVSDCTSQKKLVEHYNCGLVHLSRNTDDFCEKLIELIENEERYYAFTSNASSAFSDHLNWESLSSMLVEAYRLLLSSNSQILQQIN